MHPVLIDLGWFQLPTYGVLFALGALVAWWWFMRRARTLGLPQDPVFNAAFYALLAGIVGAKLTMIIVERHVFLADPARIFSLETLRSAGVLMGGVIAGAAAFIYYCRRMDLPLFELGDAIAAPLVLAQAVGRLGCFSSGCCYGKPTSSWIGVAFPEKPLSSIPERLWGVAIVPTQLLEMGADLVLVALLTWMWRRRRGPAGSVFWWYAILYSGARAVIELWRGDTIRGVWFWGLSTSQILAIAAIVLGAVMLARGRTAVRAAAA